MVYGVVTASQIDMLNSDLAALKTAIDTLNTKLTSALPVRCGPSVDVAVALTVTVAAYTAKYVMGGVVAFANALRAPSLSGKLMSVRISDKAVQTDNRVLWLFNANPAASTFADHGAPAIAAADISKLLGRFALGAPNSDDGTHTIYQLDNIGAVIAAPATTLYGFVQTLATPTPNSVSDLAVTIGIAQD